MPLIGMQLLRGCDLRIQAIEGGFVTIESLSLAEPTGGNLIKSSKYNGVNIYNIHSEVN